VLIVFKNRIMTISRRKFIQLSSLTGAGMFVPRFLKAFEHKEMAAMAGSDKILVVVQLSGGNDSLNTIIPYRNDMYYQGRPLIGIKKEEALPLTDEAGINPALKNLRGLYDQGYLAVMNSVGYPEPNRSHFRSMDIWQSASKADEIISTGWLGRYMDAAGTRGNERNSLAIEVDDTLSLAMKGKQRKAIAVQNIGQFHKAVTDPFFGTIAHQHEHDEHLPGYLYQTLRETISSADYIFRQSKIYTPTQSYPDTPLGKRIKTIGSLINARSDTKVYYVSHGSFDTHIGQKDRQERLFTQLDDALAALVADLQQNNRFKDVLIITFSEFGRRVAQNASQGTDHGTAGNMFFISGSLKKQGLLNDLPDLADLDEGDLKYKVDFKRVYATILQNWLQVNAPAVLGRKYDVLDFV
jgi:uncharacterized protein (DUF1501 family)